MMILTQVTIDKIEAVRRKFVDGYAWHKAIWQAFPGRRDKDRSFLFRVDDRRTEFRVLILSDEHPTIAEWGNWQSKSVPDGFLEHRRYRFQVKVNPTVKRVVDWNGQRRKNGVRVGIYREGELLEWMTQKAVQCGFEIETCAPSPPIAQFFRKNGTRGKHNSVDFSGILKVKDHEMFHSAFHHGIGPAKAFGFGLLMLHPLGD